MIMIAQHHQQTAAVGDDIDAGFTTESHRIGMLGAGLHPDILDALGDCQWDQLRGHGRRCDGRASGCLGFGARDT